MLKRVRPRSITSFVTGNGNVSSGLPSAPLPVSSAASSFRWPRAIVPSTGGRSERPSLKKLLGRKAIYFGWSCMSCRQEVEASARNKNDAETQRRGEKRGEHILEFLSAPPRLCVMRLSMRNFGYLAWLQRFQKAAGLDVVEYRVGGLDAQEETIARCQRKARNVEHRMVRHRQPAQS